MRAAGSVLVAGVLFCLPTASAAAEDNPLRLVVDSSPGQAAGLLPGQSWTDQVVLRNTGSTAGAVDLVASLDARRSSVDESIRLEVAGWSGSLAQLRARRAPLRVAELPAGAVGVVPVHVSLASSLTDGEGVVFDAMLTWVLRDVETGRSVRGTEGRIGGAAGAGRAPGVVAGDPIGGLPFTGFQLGLWLLLGAGLVAGGSALSRKGRTGPSH
jgi:hypothetical protein